ncbi:cytoplasmic protein [Bacillus sp. DNRA2]|uniref:cytoplasmic protein n=1 Tax=Bacillus sp. DNRA2 TaxID=2723053 RepID=UPI00145D4C48|nr:cytoplasmic protein [Bacillus sp. DNRA2]NMD69658.1 cytoplasmic protein [Bacillus sp. DNRA2]
MSENHNLIINGSGSYGGGFFDKVVIRGDGTVTSDFECEEFKVFGSSDILKNGTAKKFAIFGETDIHENLHADEVKILGNATVAGSAVCKRLKLMGALEVGNTLSGEEAHIKGSLSVKGDAEFERFVSNGAFEISGLLNAGIIEINPRFATSSAEEIGGDRIIVKRKTSLFTLFAGEGSLEAKIIEGDEIYLENTKAEVVRGKSVTIGAGCEIGRVEYEDYFHAEKKAVVKEQVKVD